MSTGLLVVDDEQRAREAVKRLLRRSRQLTVVGEAASGVEAVRQTKALRPDAVLMDIAMPGSDGAQGLALIKADRPGTKVVVVSRLCDPPSVWRMLSLGADGFAAKSSSLSEMEEIVDAAIRGRIAGTRAVEQVVSQFLSQEPGHSAPPRLTPRQVEVLHALAEGLDDEAISERLMLSPATVRDHIRGLLGAFGVESRLQVLVRAAAFGLVDLRLSHVNGHPSLLS